MTDYITLLGAEQVQSAASTIRSAAEQMERAASSISYALDAHRQFMDEWLAQLKQEYTSFAPSPNPDWTYRPGSQTKKGNPAPALGRVRKSRWP